MKILHVTNAVEWSGGMEQIALLVTELQKKSHENLLVCQPGSKLIDRLAPAGIPIKLIPMVQDYDLVAAWRLRRHIQSALPDIVHAHHPVAHAISLIALSCAPRPPFVVSRRVSFPPRKNPFSRWKYRSSRINKYSVVSHSVKGTLVQGGVHPSKIDVIYSGVNLEKFVRKNTDARLKEQLQIPDGVFVVGKIANFSLWKGHHVFIRAAKICLDQNPKLIFLIVGKNTESLSPMTKSLGISESVRLLGFRKDVPEILSMLDLSVNAAIEGEGLAGTLRESLLMETPVVASDVAGNREIVKDGETGLLAPSNNPEVLAEKILYALANISQLNAMAKKGREWVLRNASSNIMADNFLKLYGSLIHQSRPGP